MTTLLNALTTADTSKIMVNIVILLIVIVAASILLKKISFDSKSYKVLFISYILFWFSIMLVRQYRSDFQKGIDSNQVWVTTMIYGLVGVFFRPFFDWLQIALRNRKAIIYMALLIQFFTLLPVVIVQNQATSIIQAAGIGIGASMIATYELLFKEQYGKSRSFMTVSILAFPPLIADFAAAPIQYIVLSYAKQPGSIVYDQSILANLWIVAIAVMPITWLFTWFSKEDRSLVGIRRNNKEISTNRQWWIYIILLFIGMLITYIKFANSGSNGKLHLEYLENFTNGKIDPFMNAYLSTVFSVGQLLGSISFAWFSIKKVNKNIVFAIGSSIWIAYHVLSLFVFNPYVFFGIHIFNGISYGILYNLILGYVLSYSFKGKYFTPVGIYQAITAIGITTSGWFNSWIKQNVYDVSHKGKDVYESSVRIVDGVVLGAILLSIVLYAVLYFLETHKPKNTKKDIIDYKKNYI